MIKVLDNLNTVNYIIQNCVHESKHKELRSRNSFIVGDGYAMDIAEANKKVLHLTIRTDTLQTLCRISFGESQMLIRYGSEFMFVFNRKTQLYTTNLFDDAFSLEEIEGAFFTQNLVIDWGLNVSFDFDIMIDTLQKCGSLYNDYLVSIKK